MGNKRQIIIKISIAFVVSLIVMLISIACFKIGYETNDDRSMNLISAGARGVEYSHRLIMSNIIYGWILRLLNTIYGGINWYLILMLFFNLASITLLCIYSCKNLTIAQSLALTVIYNLILAEDYYIDLQFTKNAALYCCIGMLSFIAFIKYRKIMLFFICLLFLALGEMIRFSSFKMELPFLVTIVGVYIATNLKADLSLRRLVPFIAIIIVTLAGIWGIDYISYGGQWEYYKEFNHVRAGLYDHSGVHYEDHLQEYSDIGISQLEVDMLNEYMIADTNVFDLSMLKRIKDIEYESGEYSIRLNKEVMRRTGKAIVDAYKDHVLPVFLIGVPVIIAVFFSSLSYKVLLLLYCLISLAEYWFMACTNRFEWRAEIGAWLPLTVVLMAYYYLVHHNKKNTDKYSEISIIALATILISVFSLNGSYTFVEKKGGNYIYESDSDEIKLKRLIEDGEKFYIISNGNVVSNILNITRERYENYYRRTCSAGGWSVPSPVDMHYFTEQGITNPIKALIEREDVLFVGDDDKAELLKQFLNKYYASNVEFVNVEDKVWKFYQND